MNDIEKVIKQLQLLSTHNVAPNIMNEAIQTIIELQERIPKWHLVADGDLPSEYEKYYLCLLKGTHNYGGNIQACKYRKADKFVEHDYFDYMRNGFPKVIAWMELPKFSEVE